MFGLGYDYNKKETFKESSSFEQRKQQSASVRSKYIYRVPTIVETDKSLPDLPRKKYLIPTDLTMSQFIFMIRKKIQLPSEQAIFVFVNNTMPFHLATMGELDEHYRDEDGFLYVLIASENTFG